jgi:hypothetical protein
MHEANGDAEPCDPDDTAGERHETAKAAFEARRAAWLEEINRFLADLQSGCSRGTRVPRQLKPVVPHDLPRRPPGGDAEAGKLSEPFPVLEEEAVPFTLWWGDRSSNVPDPDAIRICVHPEVNAEYAAFSFYMDIGQRWGEPHASASHPAMSLRRRLLMDAVDDIRRIGDAQLDPAAPRGAAAVDLPTSPEHLSSPDRRTLSQLQDALKAHRNLLYVDIWEAFSQEMSCRLEDIAGDRGEVFANLRGLIMSTAGMRSAASPYFPQGAETAAVGTAPFASFSADPRFGADGVEPNAVAKAYWSLVRRITPHADFREHVACGVMDWRAIYLADVGAPSQYVAGQERPASLEEEGEAAIRVPLHLLDDAEKPLAAVAGPFDSQVRKRAGARPGNNHPVRYLLLTKHEPHPREIGRIAQCINSLGTLRLLAFKDWATVRDAEQHLRLLGQDLDRIARQWSGDRHLVGRLADLTTMRRAAREVRRLRRALRGAIGERDVGIRVQAFDVRERWPPEAVDRLRIGLPGYIPRSPLPWPLRVATFLRYACTWRRYRETCASLQASRAADIRARTLYAIAQRTEAELAGVAVGLDELALGGGGGLRLRLDRSARSARELQALLKSLRINAIPTWVSYAEHAERDLAPAFDRIRQVAKLLLSARGRLRVLAASVEASALRGQSAAGRHAAALRWKSAAYATVFLVLLGLVARSDAGRVLIGRIVEIARRLMAAAPAWMTGAIERGAAWLQAWLA